MRYADAKKLQVNDLVWVPEARRNGRVTEIEKDAQSNDLFLRIRLDQSENGSLFHHTAIRPSKSLNEIVAFFLNDPQTKVFIKHNDELGEWLYSIEVVDSDAFWLCSFDTLSEAQNYIKEHHLTVA